LTSPKGLAEKNFASFVGYPTEPVLSTKPGLSGVSARPENPAKKTKPCVKVGIAEARD